MSGIILPGMKAALQVAPKIIAQRELSAFEEDDQGSQTNETPKIKYDFGADPLGILYLCMIQTIENQQKQIDELTTKLEELKNG